MCVEMNSWWSCLYIIVTVCWQSWSGISGGKLFLVSKFHAVSSPLELSAICKRLLCWRYMSHQIDTSSFLVRMCGNIVEIVNVFIQHCVRRAVALCAAGLMSLATQFESKPNNGVLRQMESGLTHQNRIFRNPGRHVAAILQSWVGLKGWRARFLCFILWIHFIEIYWLCSYLIWIHLVVMYHDQNS
jgi:hypothetical protein